MKDLLNFFDKPKDPLAFESVRISLASPEMRSQKWQLITMPLIRSGKFATGMTATALAIRKFLTPDPLSITSTMVVKQEPTGFLPATMILSERS